MYTLIIEDRHGRSAAEISFDQGSYTIGRVDGNDVVLPSNSVSRTHARIFVSNNKCYIDDLGSANGVFVDNSAIHERTEIKNGSKIRIGEYTLYLEYKDHSDMNAGQDVLKTQIVSGGQSGYKIVRVADKFAGEEFMLSEQNNTIGRTEDNYILLSDSSISRNHAKITNCNLNYAVSDLNSSNGSFVNNKRVQGEVRLHAGDLIRFGNVSFVFVPASQHVDLMAYANAGHHKNENRMVISIFLGFILLILIAFAIAVIYITSHNDEEAQQTTNEAASAEDIQAKFNARLADAQNLFEKGLYSPALDLAKSLIKEAPDNKEVQNLLRKLDDEKSNKDILDKANAEKDSRKYDEAIALANKVSESSVNYEDAQKLIKDCESKIRLSKYNDARSNCEGGLSVKCVKDLCAVAQELETTGSERERIESTIQFMERIGQKKSKYQASAKKCAKTLKDLIE